MIGINLLKPEELENYLSKEKLSTIDILGLKFNPLTNKWKKSNDVSVNYIICSRKNLIIFINPRN